MAILKNMIGIVYQGLLKLIQFMVVVLAAFLIITVFWSVISRYFLNQSIPWIEEASRFIFVWLMLLGAILIHDTYSHMNVDLLLLHVPKKLKLLLQIISFIIILLVLGVVIKGGFIISLEGIRWLSPALEFPYGVVNSIIPISCSIMFLQTIAGLFRFAAEFAGEFKR